MSECVLLAVNIYYNTSYVVQYFLFILTGVPFLGIFVHFICTKKRLKQDLNKVHPQSLTVSLISEIGKWKICQVKLLSFNKLSSSSGFD